MTMTSQDAPPKARTIGKVILREVLNFLLIGMGVLSAGMGIEGFLMSSHFIDGGVTGISMLLAKVSQIWGRGIPLAVFLPMLNLPFIALGYRQIGRAFAIRSTLAIAGLAVALEVVPYPDVTPDRVLTAVFGGFFLGAGIGLAIRGNAVLDGTEIAALLISKRSSLLRVGDVILGVNVAIFLVAAFVLGKDEAMFSILTYISAAKTLDFLVYGIEQFTSLTIISKDQSDAIRGRITRDLGRGVTIFRGVGGHSGEDRMILYCVVTRLEIGKVKAIVREADPGAFVITQPLAEAEGGVVGKASQH
ncbi:MAG: YitT family protein [Isosphaeraceae bacterium]